MELNELDRAFAHHVLFFMELNEIFATTAQAMAQKGDIELERAFTYHPPTPENIAVMVAIRHQAKFFAYLLMQNVPESKERTIALNMVESAVMWANAGIVRNTIQMGVGEPPPLPEDETNLPVVQRVVTLPNGMVERTFRTLSHPAGD